MVDPLLNEQAYEYVLGSLREAEKESFLSEIESNPDLKALVIYYQEIGVGLALASPQLKPPLALKRAIQEALPPPLRPKRILYFPTFLSLAAAAACLALLVREEIREQRLEAWVSELVRDLSVRDGVVASERELEAQQVIKEASLNNRVAELEQQRSQMWSMQPGNIDLRQLSRLTGLPSANEQVLVAWNRVEGEGLVVITNVSAAPTAHDYQLWILVPKQNPISAGLVKADGITSMQYPFHAAVGTIDPQNLGFAISLEPLGGSPQPTGPILFLSAPKKS